MEIDQLARPPFAPQCAVTQVSVTVHHHIGNPIRHEPEQMLSGTYHQFQDHNFRLTALAGMWQLESGAEVHNTDHLALQTGDSE